MCCVCICRRLQLMQMQWVLALHAHVKINQKQHYFSKNTAAKSDHLSPLNQRVQVHFSICSLLIKALSGALLHLCLLHFFISFLSVTRFWLNVQWSCFTEGLIRRESKSICQLMFDRLITGGSIKKRSGFRWLTRQLKPLCRDLGSHPSVGWLFPSTGLLKSSIMRNFILPLNVDYVLFGKAAEMIRIWPDWTVDRACSVIVIINNYCLSLIWQRESDWPCLKWRRVSQNGANTGQDQMLKNLFPLPRTAIKAHSSPDEIPVLNVSNISF